MIEQGDDLPEEPAEAPQVSRPSTALPKEKSDLSVHDLNPEDSELDKITEEISQKAKTYIKTLLKEYFDKQSEK